MNAPNNGRYGRVLATSFGSEDASEVLWGKGLGSGGLEGRGESCGCNFLKPMGRGR
jgi:hypothetical protein